MNTTVRKNILKYSLLGIILISGFFSYASVSGAIKIPGTGDWVMPMILFSIYAVAMCLTAVLIKQEIVVEVCILVSFLFSIIFAFTLWHIAIVVFCALLMLSAMRNIGNDLNLNIKISLWKSLYVGKMKLLFALIFIISSQYYFIISSTDGQKSIPKFDTSSFSTRITEMVLGMVSPNFKAIKQQGLTVDQAIMESVQKNAGDVFSMNDFSLGDNFIDQQISDRLPADQREALKKEALQQISDSQAKLSQKNKELMLEEGRRQLSQISGQNIVGDEKLSDVLVGPIGKKINDFFQPQVQGDSKSTFYNYILVLILFLTLFPLGLVLSRGWFVIVILVFKLFVRFGIVEIKTVTVEREMIA